MKSGTRRAVLALAGTAATGGCLGFNFGTHASVLGRSVSVTADPEALLPKTAQYDGREWSVEESSTVGDDENRASVIITKEISGLVDSTSVFISADARVFPTIDEAAKHYRDDFVRSKGVLDTERARFGDEAYLGHGADDTHLVSRENNVVFDFTEMEGNPNAGDHLATSMRHAYDNLRSDRS